MIVNNLQIPTHQYDKACVRARELNMSFETYMRKILADDLANVSTFDKGINNDKPCKTTDR